MEKDFYLNERSLAGYIEKDWFDHILQSNPRKPSFAFAPFAAQTLPCDHHPRMVEFLAASLKKCGAHPKKLLEIGSSLGRTFYEVCKNIGSLSSATLVEPSLGLFSTHKKIFADETFAHLSILKGNHEQDEVVFDTRPIRAACSHVLVKHLHIRFQDFELGDEKFDLTICANVIDQCTDHMQLVNLLKNSVAPGGFLLLSCTYQWNAKYIGNAPENIRDINDLFDSSWKFIAETNLPFQVRVNERYWIKFLSHLIIYQSPARVDFTQTNSPV